jgi:GNAT superfamily N-acetyltransferase
MTVRITALTEVDGSRRVWLASAPDGTPLGSAFLRLPAGARVAELDLRVHPAERRRGVGSALLAAAEGGAREEGRRSMVTAAVDSGSPGDEFLAAQGLRRVLTLTFARRPLAGDGDGAVAARPSSGYRLTAWAGTVPDALAETFAASRRAMDDMPMDDADHEPRAWDVQRVRAIAEAVAKRGEHLDTVAAIAEADGSIVGFTELVVGADGTGDGQHYGTGVLPEHRGHGLARWMKAEGIRRARERFPELGGLLTDTADSNTYMRRINDELGYRPTHRSVVYQRDLCGDQRDLGEEQHDLGNEQRDL